MVFDRVNLNRRSRRSSLQLGRSYFGTAYDGHYAHPSSAGSVHAYAPSIYSPPSSAYSEPRSVAWGQSYDCHHHPYLARTQTIYDRPSSPSYYPALGTGHPNLKLAAIHPLLHPGPSLLPSVDLSARTLIFPQLLQVNEPATYPPRSSMLIVCDELPWTISIRAQDPMGGIGGGVVTVKDVIAGICSSLRASVTQAEFDVLPWDEREAIRRTFDERCRRFIGSSTFASYGRRRAHSLIAGRSSFVHPYSTYSAHDSHLIAIEDERRKGVKRVDWLKGRTRFGGLEQTRSESGTVWMMKVGWRIED